MQVENSSTAIAKAPNDVKTLEIPCPYIYSNGKQCPGRIKYVNHSPGKTDHSWFWDTDRNEWRYSKHTLKTYYFMTCSEHDTHQGAFTGIDVTKLPSNVLAIIEQVRSR